MWDSIRSKKINWGMILFVIILLAFSVYAAVFIHKSSFEIVKEQRQYYALFDDAMISMQYARNLARGEGLVFNPGERVEGYSNLLWVLIMSAIHLLPISTAKISLAVQILGYLFMLLLLVGVKKIADELSGGNAIVSVAAVLLTAFYYPLVNWSLLGNEVSMLAAMTAIVVWLALRYVRTGKGLWLLYLLIAISTLIRVDAVLPFIIVVGFLIYADPPNRRKHILYGGLSLFGLLIVQLVFRIVYYGEILPNTYYLKMTGFPLSLRIQRGLLAFGKFIWNSNWIIFAIALSLVVLLRKSSHLLLAFCFLIVCAYSIYIGGDAWEHVGGSNRFISIGMPMVFILFALTLETARLSIIQTSGETQNKPAMDRISISILGVFVVLSLISLNALLDIDSLNYLFLRGNPLFVPASERNTTIGLYLNEITDGEASIAVVAAGAQPYFADRRTIDMLGKIDPVIAREPARIGSGQGLLLDVRPGHSKYNFAHSIGELKPDVVVEFLRGMTPEAKPYLESDYVVISEGSLSHFLQNGQLYLLKDSPHIDWERASKIIVSPE